jgi:hypothetical protein
MEFDEPPSTRPGAVSTLERARADTPLVAKLVPVATWALTVAVATAGAAGIAVAVTTAPWWLAAFAVLLLPVAVLGLGTAIRIGGELALAVTGMSWDVARIADRLPQLADTVDDVASEMPRLGFLRVLSGR